MRNIARPFGLASLACILTGYLAAPRLVRAEESASQPAGETFHLGLDYYRGISNVSGLNFRNNDGMWAGSGTAFPSNASLNWSNGDKQTIRASFGIGDMYTARGALLHQPMELYYRTAIGSNDHVTVGKFYVPFGIQEWEYETKYGAMYEAARGNMGYTFAANYNFDQQHPNFYARAGRQCGAATNIGLSLGAGCGITYNSTHNTAVGLDVTHEVGGFKLTCELIGAVKSSKHFGFAYGKAAYTRLGSWTPYVAAYYWDDQAGDFPRFSSGLAGVTYTINTNFAIDGACGRANGKNVYWLQSHISL